MDAGTGTIELQTPFGAVGLDLASSAVVVVDMQNDFGSPLGLMARRGADIAPIRAIVEPIARVLAAARRAELRIVYLKMAYQPDLSDTGRPDAPNWTKVHGPGGVGEPVALPDGTTSRVLIRDTWNTDILDELSAEPADLVVHKHRFSGFFETPLHDVLLAHGIRSLIFTGCTTSVCVESTIRDAFFRDYRCVLLEDCVAELIGRDVRRSNHDATVLLVNRLFGWVTCSDRLIDALGLVSHAEGRRRHGR